MIKKSSIRLNQFSRRIERFFIESKAMNGDFKPFSSMMVLNSCRLNPILLVRTSYFQASPFQYGERFHRVFRRLRQTL